VSPDFLSVTELAGDEVTLEQVDRLCHRYYWAGGYCLGKDVLEAACGTGQGAGYLAGLARSYIAGDYSEEILRIARNHYGGRIGFFRFNAQEMPFADRSLDVVILFEAIYYLPSAERFVSECKRVLRPDGKVLIATANKDLYDFNPSPYSHVYYGVLELGELFGMHGFATEFWGNTPVGALPLKQKVLRPVKKIFVDSGLMPRSMAGKKLFKRIVFGSLVRMPAEISEDFVQFSYPASIPSDRSDERHKVIYCVASLTG
jgi:SAM-dependent methyltransferase